MPAPLMSRDEVISRLICTFREHGYAGASLTRISEAVGLGKASLYHYFPGGKREMAQAVIDELDRCFDAEIFTPLEGTASPDERINRMILGLDRLYESGSKPCALQFFSVGDAGELFAESLAGRVERWISALKETVEAAGVEPEEAARRAEDALIAIQGALMLCRLGGATESFRRTLAALPSRLLKGL